MLINFTVKNWKSFKNVTSLSMIKTREQQHKNRIPESKNAGLKILPAAAIYGANASGKSNLFEAIRFSRKHIIDGVGVDEEIENNPFKLDNKMKASPTEFEYNVLINERHIKYFFALNSKEVVEEKLSEFNSSGTEIVFFHRSKLNQGILVNDKFEDKKALENTFDRTRPQILFLTRTIEDNFNEFRFLYDWFRYNLSIISDDQKFNFKRLEDKKSKSLLEKVGKILKLADTGISSIEIVEKDLPENLVDDLKENFKNRIWLDRILNDFRKDIVIYHTDGRGSNIGFFENEESKGTIRLMHLLPSILNLQELEISTGKTTIIDEIDTSLHSLLVKKLIETFFESSGADSRNQLIFTSHDSSLLDQDLFRRDEMWFTKKNEFGESELYSLAEYEGVRYDMDIRRNYLIGRFDGIPKFGDISGEIEKMKEETLFNQ